MNMHIFYEYIWKSVYFRRNTGSDWISLTKVGREFQARDAAAENAGSPMAARRVSGTYWLLKSTKVQHLYSATSCIFCLSGAVHHRHGRCKA